MRFYPFMMVLIILIASTMLSIAEVFVLNDGTQVEGNILRTQGSDVTIQTSKGISAYNISEFNAETRAKHFNDISESEPVRPASDKRVSSKSETSISVSNLKSIIIMALMICGWICISIGSFWFIMAGFGKSPLWGIAMILFNGIAGFAFLIFNWDRAKAPVLTWIFGVCMILASVWLGKTP